MLNINSLANAIKPAVLPGEQLHVRVIQEGKEVGQGVGFLDDGTMIVVEGGSRYIDRELDVVVTRVLQTVAGRMIFAQPRARLSGRVASRPRVDVVVVAAASSRRMAGVDKLEAPIAGRPLLAWAIERLRRAPRGRAGSWSSRPRIAWSDTAARPWLSTRVDGASSRAATRRQESVAAGVRWPWTAEDGPTAIAIAIVLVHDGARPAVSADLVRRVIAAAAAVTGRRSPSCPSSRRSRSWTATSSAAPSTGPGSPPRRRRRAFDWSLLERAWSLPARIGRHVDR